MMRIEHLTKSFGRGPAVVNDVSFTVRPGTVTGFLGPNGAGKSTTLRMLTGLTRPNAGRATIDGIRYSDLPNPGRVVGVMLDAAAQHAGRTGRETVRLAASLLGVSEQQADATIERVGLSAAAGRRVGGYSLGMRQRLGLAVALLGDPLALILDEPANGLDPEGIRWMRELLRGFADAGGTVLLSSHLLHEVEATADHLVVIGSGRIVADGAMAELLASSGVLVRGLDTPALHTALTRAGLTVTPSSDALRVDATTETVGRIALAAGQVLTELRSGDTSGLEDLFFSLTATTDTEAAA